MLLHLLWLYRIDPEKGRFFYSRGAQLVRPQKWGKGPFSAAVACAEAAGPVRFDGWDEHGEPVGRPWATPHIQITAVSLDQSDNVWRALQPMIELGSISADIPDTGLSRVNLPGGGIIEPVTSSAQSRLGQRITFAVQDEAHSWLEANGGRQLARTQRRNLAGMGGRFMETGNAWDPAEASVAQTTHASPIGVYVDYPQPPAGSVRNKRERRRVMRFVYGDSHWVDLDRIDEEIEALIAEGMAATAERFFLNRAQAGESVAFDLAQWNSLARPKQRVGKDRLVVLGVDGARFDDGLAIVACDVYAGHVWPLGIWERPEDADDDYEHPEDEVDGVMSEAFATYGRNIWRAYVNPQLISHLTDRWSGRWGERRIIDWYTNRHRQMGYAVRNFRQALAAAAMAAAKGETPELTHDGDRLLAAHIGNGRRRATNVKDEKGRPMWVLQKERPGSPLKIDGATGAVLAWEARGDAIAAGAKAVKKAEAFFL